MKTTLLSLFFFASMSFSFGQTDTCDVAGSDSIINVCWDDTVNLFWGLGGTFDTTGTWTDPGGSLVADPGNYACPDIPGQYNFTYINQHPGCDPDTSLMIMVVDVAGCDWGLEENGIPGISMHPNPVSDVVTIENTGVMQQYHYRIYSMDGALIRQAPLEIATADEICMDDLPSGIYWIHIRNERQSGVYKIVKE